MYKFGLPLLVELDLHILGQRMVNRQPKSFRSAWKCLLTESAFCDLCQTACCRQDCQIFCWINKYEPQTTVLVIDFHYV
jgi:hypothetical protein